MGGGSSSSPTRTAAAGPSSRSPGRARRWKRRPPRARSRARCGRRGRRGSSARPRATARRRRRRPAARHSRWRSADRSRPGGPRRRSAGTERRPPRIRTSPVSPRVQRTAIALASVVTCASASSTTSSAAGGAAGRQVAAGGAHLVETLEHLGGRQLAVAADAEDDPEGRRCHPRRRQARTVASASGLASPGLVAVGQDVAATSSNTSRSRPSCVAAASRPARDRRRSGVGVDEHHGLAEERGHVGLAEAKSRRARRYRRPRARPPRAAAARRRSVQPAWAGQRVDRPPLQVMPPTIASVPECAGGLGRASAPAPTSPPPPMPTTRIR